MLAHNDIENTETATFINNPINEDGEKDVEGNLVDQQDIGLVGYIYNQQIVEIADVI